VAEFLSYSSSYSTMGESPREFQPGCKRGFLLGPSHGHCIGSIKQPPTCKRDCVGVIGMRLGHCTVTANISIATSEIKRDGFGSIR
jgi:hypothetical protein